MRNLQNKKTFFIGRWGFLGPVNIITLASTSPRFMWGVGSDRVAYINAAGTQWAEVARLDAPAYLSPDMGPVAPGAHKTIGEMSFEGKTSRDIHQIFVTNRPSGPAP